MLAAGEGEGYDPVARQRSRLAATLACSALCHAWLLFGINLPHKDRSGSGHPVLNVVLKTTSAAAAKQAVTRFNPDAPDSFPPPSSSASPRLLVRDAVRPARPQPAEPPLPATPPRRPLKEATAESSRPPPPPLPVSNSLQSPSPPAPGRDARLAAVAGGVSVLMTIGLGGRIDQMYWKTLPALTNEQFQRLEAMLRANQYAESLAGSVVTEIVDVRGLLGLPRASADTTRPISP